MTNYQSLRATPNSARTLNLLELVQSEEKPDDVGAFFKNRILNTAIIQKARVSEGDMRLLTEPRRVVTKLFVAFNVKNPDEGGRYVFLSQKNLDKVLQENLGFDIHQDPAAKSDFEILRTLDRLPSLDPFLLREQFRLNKYNISDYYFRINAAEYEKIRAAVIEEFAPIVKAAFGSADQDGHLTRMIVDKMWESADLSAIKPLIESFGIDFEQSSDVFFHGKDLSITKSFLIALRLISPIL